MTAKPTAAFHGLFLPEDGLNQDFEPEPIGKIFVTRFESSGKVRVPRHFLPEELRAPEDVYARFGGGTYEVEARRQDGSIYAKRLVTFPGEPKALVDPSTTASAPAAPAAPLAVSHSGMDPTLAIVLQMSQQNSQMMMAMMQTLGSVMAAAISGNSSKGSSPAELLSAFAQVTAANKPPPPPPPTPLAEVLTMQDTLEKMAERRATAVADAAKASAPEESTAESVKSIVEAVGPLLMALPTGPAPKLPA